MVGKVFYIKNRYNNRCLDTDGINFFLTKYDKNNNSQKWRLECLKNQRYVGIYNDACKGYLSMNENEITFVNEESYEWIFTKGKIINIYSELSLHSYGFLNNHQIEFCPVLTASYESSMRYLWKVVLERKIEQENNNVTVGILMPQRDFVIDKTFGEMFGNDYS